MSTNTIDLEKLVASAVQKALKHRKLSEAELNKLLHGPITIGLIADPHRLSPEEQQAGEVLDPGIHDKARLIGFIAPNLAQVQQKLR